MKIPIYFVTQVERGGTVPLALGLLQASLAFGREPVDAQCVPVMNMADREVALIARAFGPGIWLFSDYLWSIERNLKISTLARTLDPRNVIVHGGPSAPSYVDACRTFMTQHADIDIVCRGEGERTTLELARLFADGWTGSLPADALAQVAGLTFRAGDGEIVRTMDRPRIACLDDIPSPYLHGIFDGYHARSGGVSWVTLETNRGCPYQCTFCDWGSLTQQKIAVFDIDRVKAEIDWVGRSRIGIVHLADANVGILERDVEIAEHFARVRRQYGYPRDLTCSLTKNGSPRLLDMCRIWRDAGLRHVTIFSIQTTDPAALEAIKRRNIRTDHFEKQIAAIHDEGLDYGVELMMGLPGQTLASFKSDLQRFSDLRVTVTAYRTRLLPNSPMADPAYVAAHTIEVDDNSLVRSTSTCDSRAIADMEELFRLFDVAVNLSCLRYLLGFLQHEHGIAQVDFLHAFLMFVRQSPEAVSEQTRRMAGPRLEFLAGLLEDGAPWFDDAIAFACSAFDVPRDSGLETARAVNAAVMPRFGRVYPMDVALEHDYLAYSRDHARGVRRPLRTYGPTSFVVEDPHDWSSRESDRAFPEVILRHLLWELASPLAAAAGWSHREPSPRHGLIESI